MKKIILTLLLLSNIAFADTVFGVYAGVQTWLYDSSGHVGANSAVLNAIEKIDKNSDNSNSLFVALEHGVPFLPNIKLRHTNFEINNFVDTSLTCIQIIPGVCFPDTDIDLSHTDITLYYELLDNWVNLDLGLSAIYFSGKVGFNTNLIEDKNFSEFIPALYGKAMFELPVTDLSLSLTGNLAQFSDNTISDFELALQYKLSVGFSVEGGVRQQIVDFKNSRGIDINSDATGIFAGLNFHF